MARVRGIFCIKLWVFLVLSFSPRKRRDPMTVKRALHSEKAMKLTRSVVETQRQQRIKKELQRLEQALNCHGLSEDDLLAELATQLQAAFRHSCYLELQIQRQQQLKDGTCSQSSIMAPSCEVLPPVDLDGSASNESTDQESGPCETEPEHRESADAIVALLNLSETPEDRRACSPAPSSTSKKRRRRE